MIPKGVKIYGPGRLKAKAGGKLPAGLKNIKGAEDRIKKAGENFENKQPKKKAESKEYKPVENNSQLPLGDKK